jgi:hypothetical protein
MGSRNHRLDFYDPKTLECPAQIFEATWRYRLAIPFAISKAIRNSGMPSVSSLRRSLRMA